MQYIQPTWLRFFLGIGLAFGMAGSAAALTQVYGASLEQSAWSVQEGSQRCELIHDIPRYGRAVFRQSAGYPLRFSLELVQQPPVHADQATLRSVPPGWMHEATRLDLGKISLKRGEQPILLQRDRALRLYYELENGRFPTFYYSDWADGSDEVQVYLSAVRFRHVMAEFQACTDALLKLDFQPINETRVGFATASDRLSIAARRTLDRIIKDFREHPGHRLIVSGHADYRGTDPYNDDLSRRRADMVRRYLVLRGLSPKRVETRFFGERWPVADGDDESAWKMNRRATVWLAR